MPRKYLNFNYAQFTCYIVYFSNLVMIKRVN